MEVTQHIINNLVGALKSIFTDFDKNNSIVEIEQNATRIKVNGYEYQIIVKVSRILDKN